MAKLQTVLLRPRYLRAIPTLVVFDHCDDLGVASDPDDLDSVKKRRV